MKIRSGVKQKKSSFFKAYIIFFGTLILAIIIGYIILWNVLSSYEKTVPTNLLKPIVNEISNKDFKRILNSSDLSISEFETVEDFKENLNNNVGNGKITFSRQAVSDDDIYLYNIKSDKKDLISVMITKNSKKSKFGFSTYKVKKIAASSKAKNKVVIQAPSDAKITLNDKPVSDKYITKKDIKIEALEFVPDEIKKPSMVRYEITGLLKEGTIKATGANGNELIVNKEDKLSEYNVVPKGLEVEAAKYDILIKNVAMSFGKYVTNDAKFYEVGKLISSTSPIYSTIKGMETYWYTPHDKYEFKNIKTMDFIQYSEDCFSYRITFDHFVYRISAGVTSHKKCDYTFVFAKKDNKWLVYDMTMKNEEAK